MSIDVATLVFEFVSDSAVTTERRMDALISKGDALETQQKRVRKATDFVNDSHRTATGAVERAAKGAAALAQASTATSKAAEKEALAWAKVEAALTKRNAALRGDIAASGMKSATAEAAAWEKVEAALEKRNAKLRGDLAAEDALAAIRAADQEATAWAEVETALERRNAALRHDLVVSEVQESVRAAQTEAAAWAGVEAALERRNAEFREANLVGGLKAEASAAAELQRATADLRASIDPVAAAQERLNAELREADRLFAAGAISGGEYGRAVTLLNGRLASLNVSHTEAGKGAKLQAHELTNLGQQFADIGVSLAGGQALWLVAIQQGTQIVPIWAEASARGATLGATIKQVTGAVLALTASMAPFLAVMAAAGGAFLLWRKYVDDTKAALAATSKATQGATEAQRDYRDALVSAVDFAEKYKVANTGVAAALDDVLASQSATYRQTLAAIGANDDAGRAAVRRAELERILTVELLKQAAVKARERANDADAAVKKAQGAARQSGLFAAIGTGAIDLGQQQQAIKFRQLGGEAARKAAADERSYAASLEATAKAYQTATLTIPADTNAKTGNAAATREAKKATDDLGDALARVMESLETASERIVREANEKMLVLKRGLDAGRISADDYREAIDRLFPVVETAAKTQGVFRGELRDTVSELQQMASELPTAEDRVRDLAGAFSEAQYSLEDMLRSMKQGDIGGFLMNIQGLIGGIGTLLSQGPAGFLQLGSMAANAVGGRTGRALGGGLGLAASGVGLGAFAGTAAGATALGTIGLGAGAISSIAALAGPIGLAAGALYAAAKIFNVGGKPSNNGAGYDLITGQFSGDRRNEETEGAARAAGDTILAAQQALEAAGIKLGATVNGLVIGTRDLTQIYLSNGRTLTSAVGDSAAAVDAAMRGILEGATFQSEAQKKLIDSAIAAGKGFEELAQILDTYTQAQQLASAVDDQILKLTDPRAFDLQAVTRDIEEQRKAAKALADQGYLTADQLADLTAKLATLEGLQTNAVMQRYGAANDNLSDATESAKDALMNAYQAFAQAKSAEIAAARQTADAMKSFRQQLDFGAIAGRDPLAQYAATKREFDRLNALSANDPERVANLQAVGQAFVEASRAASPTQLAFERDLSAVRRATELSQTAAEMQADIAQQQLNAATAQLEELGLLNATTMSMDAALRAYLAAVAAEKKGANDNGLDVARYLAANPDLAENWASNGILRQLGSTLEEAARAHYDRTGQYEIEAGTRMRGYAAGGDHPGGVRLVGEDGPEIEATGPSRIYSARETARMLGGDTSRLEALVEDLTRKVESLTKQQAEDNRDIKRNTKDSANVLAKVTQGGDSLRTKDAA